MSYTPGPWTLQDDETFSTLGDKRVVGADCISPAIVFGGIRECDANARLIAAAPDLLAIVQTIVAICESGDVHLAQLACDENSPLVGEARAVLAKIEGR